MVRYAHTIYPYSLGKKYFTNAADAVSAATSLLTAINQTSSSQLISTANKKVHMELSNTADGNKYIIQYVNFIGVTGTFTFIPTIAPTTFKVPTDKEVVSVELTSPDNVIFELSPLTYTQTGQDLTFTTPVTEYALAVVTLNNSGPVTNTLPVAVGDSLTTTMDTPVNFTANQLLQNDFDFDGNTLTVTSISPVSKDGGSIIANGSLYTYTPLASIIGLDTFTYTISDGQGGTASGTVNITVNTLPGTVTPTPNQVISALYTATFKRAPDQAGLTFWESHFSLNSEEAVKQLAAGFASHPVFTQQYGALSNQAFVDAIYKNVLGGPGDLGGVNFWTDAINNGLSRSDFLAAFVQSALTVDLNAALQAGQLTQSEYDAAVIRQNFLNNKANVGLYFTNTLGIDTNLLPTTDASIIASLNADPAYQASIAILNRVDNTAASVVTAQDLVNQADASTDSIKFINDAALSGL